MGQATLGHGMPPLAALAPEHRAVLDLVVGRGRSYGEIAALLAVPEASVRARARAALTALAPPTGLDTADAEAIADEVLGQRTAPSTLDHTHPAQAWAAALERELAPLRGGNDRAAASGEAARGGGTAAPSAATVEATGPGAVAAGAARGLGPARRVGAGRGSTLALAGGLLAVLGIALAFLFLTNDETDEGQSTRAAATATPTATAPALQPAGEVALRSVGDSDARGVMAVFEAGDGRLAFTIGAEGLPRSREGEAYAVWFLSEGRAPRRLGFTDPVGEDGRLIAGGPQSRDADRFPRLLATADEVVVARATSERASRPGRVALRGRIPARLRERGQDRDRR